MHAIYCGVTMTGKTTLARMVARGLARKKQRLIVFDPVGTETKGGGWPEEARIFDDPEKFLDYMDNDSVTDAHVFVDEADEIFGHQQKENFWMLKKGRHFGLRIHLITQRPKMVHPTARNQCGTCYMFRLASDDARMVAADFGHDYPLSEKELDTGDFFVLQSGSVSINRANVFTLSTKSLKGLQNDGTRQVRA